MEEAARSTASNPVETAPPPATGAAADRWQRLHAICGAIALGVFLVGHLLVQASATAGSAGYARTAGKLASLRISPLVDVLVVIAIGFHAGYGLYRLRRPARSGAQIDRYGSRRLWGLQRASALVLLVFLLVHLWELRIQRLFFGMEPSALYTVLSARLSWTWAGVPWLALLYILGIAAASAHLSNGLFAFTARGERGRRRARIAMIVFGTLLFSIGTATVIGFATGTRLLPAPDADSAPCGPTR